MLSSDGDLTNNHVTNDDDANSTNTSTSHRSSSPKLAHGQDLIYCKQTARPTVVETSSQGQTPPLTTLPPLTNIEELSCLNFGATAAPSKKTNDEKDGGLRLRRDKDNKRSIVSKDQALVVATHEKTMPIDYEDEDDDANYTDEDEKRSFCSSNQRLILASSKDLQYDYDGNKRAFSRGTGKGCEEKPGKQLAKKTKSQLLKCLVANSSTSLLEDVPLYGDSCEIEDSSINILSPCSQREESSLQTATQIFIPFIIAGCGTVGAGMVLDNVQHWDVFKRIDEIYILLPALLGLKGNLEMTLASRLSTHANLGDMDSRERRVMIASGNIALTQCQATIVSLMACILAFTINLIYTGSIDLNNVILITAAALLTAAIASLSLGLLMIVVVFVAQAYNVNPDNIATPIAASLGDLITLSLYAFLTDLFYNNQSSQWLSITLICTFILLIPVWAIITRSNKFTRDVLYNGWTPILAAMIISSISGVILNIAVSRFTGIAVFHPVICGVGGNLVAVQASRLSTDLHRSSPLGVLPFGETIYYNPITVIFGKDSNSKTSRLLIAMAIPGHLLFAFIIATFESGHMKITATFLLIYSFAAELQIVILLYLAYILTRYMWHNSIDPDNSSIPYLTAFGDFFGTTFLSLAFMLMHVLHANDLIRT